MTHEILKDCADRFKLGMLVFEKKRGCCRNAPGTRREQLSQAHYSSAQPINKIETF
jgi:hypothetical protein